MTKTAQYLKTVICKVDDKEVKCSLYSTACRCLFGPVDHAQVRLDLLAQRRQMRQQACERWNFDFEACLPLDVAEGRFQWTSMSENVENWQTGPENDARDVIDVVDDVAMRLGRYAARRNTFRPPRRGSRRTPLADTTVVTGNDVTQSVASKEYVSLCSERVDKCGAVVTSSKSPDRLSMNNKADYIANPDDCVVAGSNPVSDSDKCWSISDTLSVGRKRRILEPKQPPLSCKRAISSRNKHSQLDRISDFFVAKKQSESTAMKVKRRLAL